MLWPWPYFVLESHVYWCCLKELQIYLNSILKILHLNYPTVSEFSFVIGVARSNHIVIGFCFQNVTLELPAIFKIVSQFVLSVLIYLLYRVFFCKKGSQLHFTIFQLLKCLLFITDIQENNKELLELRLSIVLLFINGKTNISWILIFNKSLQCWPLLYFVSQFHIYWCYLQNQRFYPNVVLKMLHLNY